MLLKLSLRVESDEGQNCHSGQTLIISSANWELLLTLIKCHIIQERLSLTSQYKIAISIPPPAPFSP